MSNYTLNAGYAGFSDKGLTDAYGHGAAHQLAQLLGVWTDPSTPVREAKEADKALAWAHGNLVDLAAEMTARGIPHTETPPLMTIRDQAKENADEH